MIYTNIDKIEMHIVDHCNLNCNCCNHFSPLAKPWFISLEDFKEQVTNIKNNMPWIKRLILLGGEPTLHPQLLELCHLAREILGYIIDINIFSNGILAKSIQENEEQYKILKIQFYFTPYYQFTDIDAIKNISSDISIIHYNRLLSKEILVNNMGTENGKENFFHCTNYRLPCLTLKNNKIYVCPFSAHIQHYCNINALSILEKEGIDFIYIQSIKGNKAILQDFIHKPKTYCNYCKQNKEVQPFLPLTSDYKTTLYSLYKQNYKEYEKIINANKENISWILSDNNPGIIDINYYYSFLQTELLRYKTGKIDIIIPYYNESFNTFVQLKKSLLNQSIIQDCVIYFISDGSNMDQCVLNLFRHEKDLHCVFLRNETNLGPGAARNKGIENSYNKYVLFMDADDIFYNDTSLESIYNKIDEQYLCYNFTAKKLNNNFYINRFLVKREILKQIYFKEFYFCEDADFKIKLYANIPQENIYTKCDRIMYYNILQRNNNLTSIFYHYDKNFFHWIVSYFISFYEVFQQHTIENFDTIIEFINNYFSTINLYIDNKIINNDLFTQNLLLCIIKLCSKYHMITMNDKNIKDIINKQFLNLSLSQSYLFNYLTLQIQKQYLTNKIFCKCARMFLDIISQENF